MDNDSELLRRYIQQRDEPAFADFVNRNLPLVYSAALRRLDGDAAASADVAQTVFTQVGLCASTLVQHPCWPAGSTQPRGAQRRILHEASGAANFGKIRQRLWRLILAIP